MVWSTLGLSWFAWVFAPARKSGATSLDPNHASSDFTPIRLEILVVAHNEGAVIRQTLESLLEAARRLRMTAGQRFELSITVGLDHCSDATAQIVQGMAATAEFAINPVENTNDQGKWNTLTWLVARSQASWVACVDAGSVWEPGLLAAAWPQILDLGVMGVAPSYGPGRSGALERANWRLERMLKTLENPAGGPVSVHGATVLYRRSTLLNALAALQGTGWLNDDVVIPLTLRLQNPQLRISYLSAGAPEGWVRDVGITADLTKEFNRRRRMVMGNLQWIRGILMPQLSILMIASRRVFRVFWAYWALLAILGLGLEIALALHDPAGAGAIARALLIELLLLATGLMVVGGLLFSNWVRRLAMAFGNGLLVTRYWKELEAKRGISWV